MTAGAQSTEHWDRYWAYGNLHSFSQVHEGNYRGSIADFWTQVFAALADGSRIVDIGTGNGALPLLALEVAERQGWQFDIHGTDIAAVDPLQRVQDESLRTRLAQVHFHARTAAESLPFEDGSIQLVCSQFGIEYSDLDQSIPEVARILAADGRVAFMLHHTGSVFLQSTGQEIEQIDFVLDDVQLYLKCRNLLRTLANARKPGQALRGGKAGRKQATVSAALDRIDAAARQQPNPQMLLGPANYVREILGRLGDVRPRELLQWLEEAQARVLANRQRLRDMRAAARSEADMAQLEAMLTAAGIREVEWASVVQPDGSILGWRLSGRR